MCRVNFSVFPGDRSRGNRGNSIVKSFPSLGKVSKLNLAVSQLSVSVVIVIVTAVLTPEEKNYYIHLFVLNCQ